MSNWQPGDMHAAFVALFILLIAWFLTFLPKLTRSSLTTHGTDESPPTRTKSHHAFSIARDAVLLLTTSLLISYGGKANQAATNALSYIYMAIYLVVVASYWSRSKVLLTSLQLLAYALMLALVIMAFATAQGRG
jgi:hypothetical protein